MLTVLRSYAAWFVPAALTLLSFGSGNEKAIAQTLFPFSGNYDVTIAVEPINEKFSRAIERAVSTDALYGLTEYNGLVYALTDFSTGLFTFNTDPTAIGLEGFPEGFIEFSGSGANKVSGTATATALIDFVNLRGSGSGSLIITGGEGIFRGATGILDFFENDTISPNPNDPIRGQALVTGTIKVVPEPETGVGTLVGIGLIGAGFMLRRRCFRSAS
ncbi:PEP-CTERM sorting domain-containing protein [Nostoc flagelliforme FACHB-838]|uniref:PEP-CTERM sorting domain-containing protein n=1 Tax=Nostoc flagelliforme FACHB-838 TaxID=2692904 RepID=A0ABR8DSX0_9NOSO|nr:PEP-CTERM sorting domain-containing protein [Nostoc flagelliforme]MBD2532537.1 PEP-CTERM sorting domain-containing protein [Nostoc flagelliforme FACHB-838]